MLAWEGYISKCIPGILTLWLSHALPGTLPYTSHAKGEVPQHSKELCNQMIWGKMGKYLFAEATVM